MQALHDLVQLGLVRYIGMSSCWAYEFSQMQSASLVQTSMNDLTPYQIMQSTTS
jgi:aryl-alcohol dehydrogenase-like predicted oxidoreductase